MFRFPVEIFPDLKTQAGDTLGRHFTHVSKLTLNCSLRKVNKTKLQGDHRYLPGNLQNYRVTTNISPEFNGTK